MSCFESNPFNVFQERLIIAMVGLPARGKSYLSQAIVRYMNYIGCPTRIFNAGNLRRRDGLAGTNANFFDQKNEEAKELREKLAMECLDEAIQWIQDSPKACSIGILDATNTTVARRKKVIKRINEEYQLDPRIKLIFVETQADDQDLLENNYRMKLANDDYKGKDPEQALEDFRKRVKMYESVYEPLSDEHDGNAVRYIKLMNAGEKLVAKNVEGFLLRRLQRLLGSTHLWPRTIWLALVGETENDLKGVLGGDPSLSEAGLEYTDALGELVAKREEQCDTAQGESGVGKLFIYTGTSKRYIQSAEILYKERKGKTAPCRSWSRASLPPSHVQECQVLTLGAVNDVNAGLLDSLSQEEREKKFPKEVAARKADKLNYRYPGTSGESYQDLISRCGELVCMLEQSRGNSLVICDRAIFRVVSAYFCGQTIDEIPHMCVNKGVLELSRSEKGFSATEFDVGAGRATTSHGPGTVLN